MPFPWLMIIVQLVIGLALQVIGFLMMPKTASDKPEEVTDMENPTAEAGRPIPVIFGEPPGGVTSLNIIWYGDKSTTTRKVKA